MICLIQRKSDPVCFYWYLSYQQLEYVIATITGVGNSRCETGQGLKLQVKNTGMILARGFAAFPQNIEDRPIFVNDGDPCGPTFIWVTSQKQFSLLCSVYLYNSLSQIFLYTVTDHFPSIFCSALDKFIVVGWPPNHGKWADRPLFLKV